MAMKMKGEIQFSNPIKIVELKSNSNDWEVSGYVSTFNNMDLGQDVVKPGAFTRTLKENPKVRFLRDHDSRLVLGVPLALAEDKTGLFGRFKISKTKLGEETHELIQDGALDSFSIGYIAQDYEIDNKNDIRYLKDVDLYEASMVSIPMNPEAVVTGYKDYLTSLGIRADLTLAEKTHVINDAVCKIMNDWRGLVGNNDRPLSETKRQELTELLELCSGWDAVRSELQKVLTAAPTNPVDIFNLAQELGERKKRLAFLQE